MGPNCLHHLGDLSPREHTPSEAFSWTTKSQGTTHLQFLTLSGLCRQAIQPRQPCGSPYRVSTAGEQQC